MINGKSLLCAGFLSLSLVSLSNAGPDDGPVLKYYQDGICISEARLNSSYAGKAGFTDGTEKYCNRMTISSNRPGWYLISSYVLESDKNPVDPRLYIRPWGPGRTQMSLSDDDGGWVNFKAVVYIPSGGEVVELLFTYYGQKIGLGYYPVFIEYFPQDPLLKCIPYYTNGQVRYYW